MTERIASTGTLRADDIAAARDIQTSILPPQMPIVPGYDLYGCLRPAEDTGGDMFDLVTLEQGVFILLGDATGHGFGPALCATQMQAMFRVAFRVGAALEEAYIHVNNQLDEDLPDDRFVTAFAGFLNPERDEVKYFSAGQGPILHYRAAEDCCDCYGPTTFPLGTLEVSAAGPNRVLHLAPGDVLAVFSDGVFECEGPAGVYGRHRAAGFLSRHAGLEMADLAERILAELNSFSGGDQQQDDLTLVLVKREAGVRRRVKLTLSREISQLKRIVEARQAFFDQNSLLPLHANTVDLAMEELYVNMIRHNRQAQGPITLEMQVKAGDLRVAMSDHDCDYFDPQSVDPIDTTVPLDGRAVGGLGLHLVRQLVEELQYHYANRTGTISFVVRMEPPNV